METLSRYENVQGHEGQTGFELAEQAVAGTWTRSGKVWLANALLPQLDFEGYVLPMLRERLEQAKAGKE